MADKPTVGKQGKRYSADEKADIMRFIAEYNAENNRGGMKAASDKYGVSVVTLSNWGKGNKAGKRRKAKAKAKAKAKKVVAQKVVKTAAAAPITVDADPDAILSRLLAIRAEISVLEKEYDGLKKKL